MSSLIKYDPGPDGTKGTGMSVNMFGLPKAAIDEAEQAVTTDEIVRLRHIYAHKFFPPLAFNQVAGEFEYLTDQQGFELFVSGFVASKQPLPELDEKEIRQLTLRGPVTIPKMNLDAIEEGERRLKEARERAEEAAAILRAQALKDQPFETSEPLSTPVEVELNPSLGDSQNTQLSSEVNHPATSSGQAGSSNEAEPEAAPKKKYERRSTDANPASYFEPNKKVGDGIYYTLYWHISEELLEKNLTENDVTLNVIVTDFIGNDYDYGLTFQVPESQKNVLSLAKHTGSADEGTNLYVASLLMRYGRLTLQTEDFDFWNAVNSELQNSWSNLQESVISHIRNHWFYSGSFVTGIAADGDEVVLASGFPMVRFIELQAKAHGVPEVLEPPTVLIIKMKDNEDNTAIVFDCRVENVEGGSEIRICHGQYRVEDLPRLIDELVLAMTHWPNLCLYTADLTTATETPLGILRRAVIEKFLNASYSPPAIFLLPTIKPEECEGLVQNKLYATDSATIDLASDMTGTPASIYCDGSEAPLRVGDISFVGNNIVVSGDDETYVGENVYTGVISAGNVVARQRLLEDRWVNDRVEALNSEMEQLLRNPTSTPLDKALIGAVNKFIVDLDQELSKRLSSSIGR
jgi:hypothetical protein